MFNHYELRRLISHGIHTSEAPSATVSGPCDAAARTARVAVFFHDFKSFE